jgi:hypothetical protein
MKRVIKRLLCKHEYEKHNVYLIDAGMGKMFIFKCIKCQKEKAKFV